MYKCLDGHNSSTGDFCSVCGLEIESANDAADASNDKKCPGCGIEIPQESQEQLFCQNCGYDFQNNAPFIPMAVEPEVIDTQTSNSQPIDVQPATQPTVCTALEDFELRIWPDPKLDIYDNLKGRFPADTRETTISIIKEQYIVGRESDTLDGLPKISVVNDPAVSRLHFKLIKKGDAFELHELSPTTSTKINGRKLAPGEYVALSPDDDIIIGAWTRIKLFQV